MPEQLTKYPDVTLQVLRSAGAVCGGGAPQQILKQCPAERFCSLPGGELCIYGTGELAQMTQLTPQELAAVVCPGMPQGATLDLPAPGALSLAVGFLAGLALGRLVRGRRRSV
jgi:hypothetical protein